MRYWNCHVRCVHVFQLKEYMVIHFNVLFVFYTRAINLCLQEVRNRFKRSTRLHKYSWKCVIVCVCFLFFLTYSSHSLTENARGVVQVLCESVKLCVKEVFGYKSSKKIDTCAFSKWNDIPRFVFPFTKKTRERSKDVKDALHLSIQKPLLAGVRYSQHRSSLGAVSQRMLSSAEAWKHVHSISTTAKSQREVRGRIIMAARMDKFWKTNKHTKPMFFNPFSWSVIVINDF